jgi:hypothetical protein
MRSLGLYFSFCVLVLVSAACTDDEELPSEPVINEISFDTTVKALQFRFTDGDGNFGLSQNDILPPYQPYEDDEETIPNRFHYNLWVDYFEKIDGEWEQVFTASTIDFRVPILTPAGQNKQLRVLATYDMSSFLPFITAESDTIKFQVRIVDRALNVSNMAETEPIVLPN